MTTISAPRAVRTVAAAQPLSQTTLALAIAALATAAAELVLLRLTSRVGIHIPALGWARSAYAVAVAVGNFVFPLASVFATAAVVALALALLRRAPVLSLLVFGLLGLQVTLLRGAGASAVAAHEFLLAATLLALAVIVLSARPVEGRARGVMLFTVLGAGAQALGQVQAASANLTAVGGPALPLALATAGELLLLGALVTAPLLLRPAVWPRGALVAGAVAAVLVGGAMLGSNSTARILALWTFGLAMPAPAMLYLVAAATTTATVVAQARTGNVVTAVGLALLVLGGYLPPNSYQANLVLAGLFLISFPLLYQSFNRAKAA